MTCVQTNAEVQDLVIIRGDSFSTVLTFANFPDLSDFSTNSEAAIWEVGGDKVLDFATDWSNAASGQLRISLTATQTAGLPTDALYWYVRLASAVDAETATHTAKGGCFTVVSPETAVTD